MIKTKPCIKCNAELPMTDEYFSPRSDSKDGLRNDCRICKSEYGKNRHKDNREAVIKYKREWNKTNRLVIAEYNRQYRQDNKVAICEQDKQYRADHKESSRVYAKQYWLNNRETLIEQRREYYLENKEIFAVKARAYCQKHLEEFRVRSQMREARKLLLPSTLTLTQWEDIKSQFNNKCCYCGKEKPLHQEHFSALSKGGEYTHNNIIPACQSCNTSKRAEDFLKWYPRQRFYSKKREKFLLLHLGYKDNIQQLALL